MLVLRVRVEADYFVAGLTLDPISRRVTSAAPILAWTVGHSEGFVQRYIHRRGWMATIKPVEVPDQ